MLEMKEILQQRLHQSLLTCYENGTLHSGIIPPFVVEVPGNPEHGDYATNAAMLLARDEKKRRVKLRKLL